MFLYGDSLGEGVLFIFWVRLFGIDLIFFIRDVGFRVVDSYIFNEKSFFCNRIVKKKEGCLCLSYKFVMF